MVIAGRGRAGVFVYHRSASVVFCTMKQIKLVRPRPAPKRDLSVDTRTPSGKRALPY